MDNEDRDALDSLRSFIKEQKIRYATIRVEIEIENCVARFVRLHCGDVVYKIKPQVLTEKT